jgi:hypothetical protein
LIFPLMAKHSSSLPFFFFAAMMVVDFVIVFFYYPETARVSLENMQHTIVH